MKGINMDDNHNVTDAELIGFKKRLAIVILAYADYESLEIALATHVRFSVNSGVDIYVLQNGRGTYDCERTYQVAKRYHYLCPDVIHVIDDIPPGIPFESLLTLFCSSRFEKYDYIIKMDDDVLVLTEDWIDKLCVCYLSSLKKYGNELAYVTSLVNNNPYGFSKIIEKSENLSKEYYEKIARVHYVGPDADDPWAPNRVLPKTMIYSGSNGTIWRNSNIARWLHKRTTLLPEEYIKLASGLGYEEVNNKERYSINCILFEKKLWTEEIGNQSKDDEHLLHRYCLRNDKKIIADLSIPMVHLFFFIQRDHCRDMIDDIRLCYTDYLNLEFPISLCSNRLIEIENRLRYLEKNGMQSKDHLDRLGNHLMGSLSNVNTKTQRKPNLISRGMQCLKNYGVIYTIKRAIILFKHKLKSS